MVSKKRKQVFLSVSFCFAMTAASAGVTAAYLSRSPGEVCNVITAGAVEGKLTEEQWDPENGKNVYPGQSMDKDPVVENVGENEAWVFLEVAVPVETIALVDDTTGRKTEKEKHELFSFQADTDSWELLSHETSESQGSYLYGYKNVVEPGEKTEPLFHTVETVNYLEGEPDIGQDNGIHVTAGMIQNNMQTTNLEQIYREFLEQRKEDEKGGEE